MKKINPVGWFEILVSDMDRAKKFYENVFEVELSPIINSALESEGSLLYGFPSDFDQYGSPGALFYNPEMRPSGTGAVIYFTCEDCGVEEKKFEKFGGKILKPRFSIDQYGFVSLVEDSEGNMLGLHSQN
jgi:predicted enzyme related to lactoylglutathione lyase